MAALRRVALCLAVAKASASCGAADAALDLAWMNYAARVPLADTLQGLRQLATGANSTAAEMVIMFLHAKTGACLRVLGARRGSRRRRTWWSTWACRACGTRPR